MVIFFKKFDSILHQNTLQRIQCIVSRYWLFQIFLISLFTNKKLLSALHIFLFCLDFVCGRFLKKMFYLGAVSHFRLVNLALSVAAQQNKEHLLRSCSIKQRVNLFKVRNRPINVLFYWFVFKFYRISFSRFQHIRYRNGFSDWLWVSLGFESSVLKQERSKTILELMLLQPLLQNFDCPKPPQN